MKRYPAIIAYDIVSNKRRRKLLRLLQAWSLDSQYSLFECLLSQAEAEELFLQLTAMINEKEDKLFLAWVNQHQAPFALGKQQPSFSVPSLFIQ